MNPNTTEVQILVFNHEGEVLTVNSVNGFSVPRSTWRVLKETQREAAVRILNEQTSFDITISDLAVLYFARANSNGKYVMSYFCTKVLENPMQQHRNFWTFGSGNICEFQGTRKFLDNCVDSEYNHEALYHASVLSEQMKLPWSNYQNNQKDTQPKLSNSDTLQLQLNLKDKQMETKVQPKELKLQEHKTYLTREGKEVTMSVDYHCGKDMSHQFRGSNGFYYKTDGNLSNNDLCKWDAISEVQVTPKLYTQAEVLHCTIEAYKDGKASVSTFSTPEIQSLIAQQTVLIRKVELEILELKELGAFLGGRSDSRVLELRAKVYTDLGYKQKKLKKLVDLQLRLKRIK